MRIYSSDTIINIEDANGCCVGFSFLVDGSLRIDAYGEYDRRENLAPHIGFTITAEEVSDVVLALQTWIEQLRRTA